VLVPLTQAFCAAARACCSAEGMPAELGDCESNFPRRDSTFASLMRGAATLDQAGLPACLASYQQAATKCEELPVWNACKGLLHGLRKENEKCVDVGECARDAGQTVACVIADSNAKEGVCTKVPHGKLGDACGTTCRVGDSCSFTSIGASDPSSITYCYEQDGLFCSFDTGHCQAIIALGSPCTASDSCGSTSFCDTTCKKSGVLGEACTQSCIPALSCINGQCRSPSFTVGGTCSGFWFGPY